MTAATVQPAARRPASGIAIDPEQLTRMRDLVPLSREDLAERAGLLLFDYARFARVLDGTLKPDAATARVLWLALDCAPGEIIRGLPPELPRNAVPRWLRANWDAWSLDLAAVHAFAAGHHWDGQDLAAGGCPVRFQPGQCQQDRARRAQAEGADLARFLPDPRLQAGRPDARQPRIAGR